MLKRTLIVIAVVALIATSAQALGPNEHRGDSSSSPSIKGDFSDYSIGWPFEYKALTICEIPVFMNVGYYVQVEKCNERKIILQQVDCVDDGFGKEAKNWPCYYDCETVKIRANFQVKLGVDRVKIGSVIKNWSASVTPDTVGPSSGYTGVSVCVKAWDTELWKAGEVGKKIRVGTIKLTVKPNV